MQQLAGFLQKQYLMLLLGYYFIQLLQQIFLIGRLNLQLNYSLLAHILNCPTSHNLKHALFNLVVDDYLVRMAVCKIRLFNNPNQIARLRHGTTGFGDSRQQPDLFETG